VPEEEILAVVGGFARAVDPLRVRKGDVEGWGMVHRHVSYPHANTTQSWLHLTLGAFRAIAVDEFGLGCPTQPTPDTSQRGVSLHQNRFHDTYMQINNERR